MMGQITRKELGRGEGKRLKGYRLASPDGHDVCVADSTRNCGRIRFTETGEVKMRDRVKGKRG
ncbi:MAG: hypothetical protein ACE5I8_06275 [Thermodesulfobacteriota bacterium]